MPTDELATERAHLTSSREHLARMRARASSMDSSAAADWVSRMLLESAQGRRLKALEDDPTVPLFFGRLDYAEGHPEAGRPFYIGRRHVSDETGDPMVVDWRAPISLPFYRASTRDSLGVATRRRFGFRGRAGHGVRGRAPGRGPDRLDPWGLDPRGLDRWGLDRRVLSHPRGGDRAPPRRTDARHRRHHPARAGRHRPRRPVGVDLRPGRPRHRQDRRRAAPRGLPALRLPRTAAPPGCARRRSQRELPALHRRRPPGPRRDRGAADHHRAAGRHDAGRRQGDVRDQR